MAEKMTYNWHICNTELQLSEYIDPTKPEFQHPASTYSSYM